METERTVGNFLNGPGEEIRLICLSKGVGSGNGKGRWLFATDITMLESTGLGD